MANIAYFWIIYTIINVFLKSPVNEWYTLGAANVVPLSRLCFIKLYWAKNAPKLCPNGWISLSGYFFLTDSVKASLSSIWVGANLAAHRSPKSALLFKLEEKLKRSFLSFIVLYFLWIVEFLNLYNDY